MDGLDDDDNRSAGVLLEPRVDGWVETLDEAMGAQEACRRLQDAFLVYLDQDSQEQCESAFNLRVDSVEDPVSRLRRTISLILGWEGGVDFLDTMDDRIQRWIRGGA